MGVFGRAGRLAVARGQAQCRQRGDDGGKQAAEMTRRRDFRFMVGLLVKTTLRKAGGRFFAVARRILVRGRQTPPLAPGIPSGSYAVRGKTTASREVTGVHLTAADAAGALLRRFAYDRSCSRQWSGPS